jgi:hypothetical protein
MEEINHLSLGAVLVIEKMASLGLDKRHQNLRLGGIIRF